jgi:hypothetical protein
MFNVETVFVIGAGASCELGFPTGVGLKGQIGRYLNAVHSQGGRLVMEDDELREAFMLLAGQASLSQWLEASRRVSAGMAIAPSIDNYLHTHSDNPLFARCGKLAITSKILAAERKSPIWAAHGKNPDLSNEKLQSSWLPRFAWQLVVDVSKQDAHNVFGKLHFVIFNYDRCVEQYLYLGLQAYYDLTGPEAAKILNQVGFYHPYGTVGALPWQVKEGPVADFGAAPDAAELIKLSDGIRTFTESVQTDDYLSAARDAYLNCKQVLFLGFSFGKQNMHLLAKPKGEVGNWVSSGRRVYGTSFGVSDDDQAVFTRRVKRSWPAASTLDSVALHDLTCAALFDRYSQSIAGER